MQVRMCRIERVLPTWTGGWACHGNAQNLGGGATLGRVVPGGANPEGKSGSSCPFAGDGGSRGPAPSHGCCVPSWADAALCCPAGPLALTPGEHSLCGVMATAGLLGRAPITPPSSLLSLYTSVLPVAAWGSSQAEKISWCGSWRVKPGTEILGPHRQEPGEDRGLEECSSADSFKGKWELRRAGAQSAEGSPFLVPGAARLGESKALLQGTPDRVLCQSPLPSRPLLLGGCRGWSSMDSRPFPSSVQHSSLATIDCLSPCGFSLFKDWPPPSSELAELCFGK